jgi:predicted CoA-substrate-specific enzyme activase
LRHWILSWRRVTAGSTFSFADKQITEITCHARGIRAIFPFTRIIIDIGGQDSKGIKLDKEGNMANFVMNDKCAAGTGRFLEVIAETLCVKLTDLGGGISLAAAGFVKISNMCAVFAESETVSRIAEGARAEDILAGVHRAMASKVAMLVKRVKLEPDVVLTGGGGEDAGLVLAISGALGLKVLVPEQPRLTASFGAACLAEEGLP